MSGLKLIVAQGMTLDYHPREQAFISADIVRASSGEWVLTVSGNTARRASGKKLAAGVAVGAGNAAD